MTDYTLNQLGERLLAQVYQIITGGDAKVSANPNTFVTWCMPGLPFQPEDFTFCEKGFGGGADAEEERKLLNQAFAFSQQVDFIPDPTGCYKDDQQQNIWQTSQNRLSNVYGAILNSAIVAKGTMTKAEQKKLDEFRKLLVVQVEKKNLVTKKKEISIEDSEVVKLYKQYQAAYEAARMEYNNRRIAAMTAAGPEGKMAVADWSLNGTMYQNRVAHALDEWAAKGYKGDLEQINAYIQEVTSRSLLVWKENLKKTLQDAKISALGPGQEFYWSTLIPGSFASRPTGWTRFAFSHEKITESSHTESNSWSGGLSGFWSLFIGGGGVSGSSSHTTEDKAVSSFKISFDLTQAVVSRPWFYPEFFNSRGWKLGQDWAMQYDDMPSDGQIPPKGKFIAYPATVIFARNIEIVSADFVSHFNEYSNSVSVGMKVGWGPFALSGSYGHADSGRNFTAQTDNQCLKVDGMQILGFVNHLIGKAPNPLETLKDEDFEMPVKVV